MPINIKKEVFAIVDGDKDQARDFFGKPVTEKLIRSLTPGIEISQKVIDKFAIEASTNQATAAPADTKPALSLESSIDEPESKPASDSISRADIKPLFDKIEAMRELVRVSPEGTVEDILKAIREGKWSRRVMMLVPMAMPIPPVVNFAICAHLRRQPWLGYHQEKDTLIQPARNRCADVFLKSEADWAWFLDSDMVAPFGAPGFFYKELGISQSRIAPKFLDFNAVERLLSRKKSLIAGTYVTRKAGGRVCHPVPENVNTHWMQRGPSEEVIKLDWVATGCLLVHRSVFTDIMKAFPERRREQYFDFFGHDVGVMGEDASFCRLAAKAGHESFLDLSVPCGHVGNQCFM